MLLNSYDIKSKVGLILSWKRANYIHVWVGSPARPPPQWKCAISAMVRKSCDPPLGGFVVGVM